MRMRKKLMLFLVVLLTFQLLFAGIVFSADEETVRIGVIQPLTGDVAFDGQTAVEGARLAAKFINESGGVLGGREIELVIEDGRCEPSESVSAAEKLIVREKVSAITGCFCSSSTGAVMPLAEENEIPLVTGISTSPSLTQQGNEYFFRAVGTSKLFARAFAKALKNELNINRIAYLVVNDDWGRGSMESFSEAFAELGGENVAKEIFNRGESDFYSYLTKIKAANPDGIYVVANTSNAAKATNQIKELGIEAEVFGEGAWTSDTYLELTGDNSEGIYGVVEYMRAIDTAENEKFVQGYEKMFDKNPSKYSAAIYQTINIIAEAIDRAGSDDPKAIRDALVKTNYKGLSGTVRFNENHQAYGFNMYMSRIENGVPKLALRAQLENPLED